MKQFPEFPGWGASWRKYGHMYATVVLYRHVEYKFLWMTWRTWTRVHDDASSTNPTLASMQRWTEEQFDEWLLAAIRRTSPLITNEFAFKKHQVR